MLKPLRSLRALRDIYINLHTWITLSHAKNAENAKILLYNAIAGGVAGSARQENAEVGGNQLLYSIFVCHPTSVFSALFA